MCEILKLTKILRVSYPLVFVFGYAPTSRESPAGGGIDKGSRQWDQLSLRNHALAWLHPCRLGSTAFSIFCNAGVNVPKDVSFGPFSPGWKEIRHFSLVTDSPTSLLMCRAASRRIWMPIKQTAFVNVRSCENLLQICQEWQKGVKGVGWHPCLLLGINVNLANCLNL